MKRNIVIGPPGTGKTTFLKDKVDALINGGHCRADEIGYFSFTVKAAEEIRDRVTKEEWSEAELKKMFPYFVRFTRSLINDYSYNNHRSWIKVTMMTYHGTRDVSLLTR